MKTIRELAKEIGIDKQRVYRYIKKHHIIEAHQKQGAMYYDDVAEQQITKHFSSGHISSEAHYESSPKITNDTIISIHKSEIDFKNALIKEQQQTIKELTAMLKIQIAKTKTKLQKRKFKNTLPEIKNMGVKKLMKSFK